MALLCLNSVRREPKRETSIQPTLDVLFVEAFEKRGIRVSREGDEGVGALDFCFSHTSSKGQLLKVNLEVKLAHNDRIEHGLRHQLVAYLRANRSSHGIFLVLWFKDNDGSSFDRPSGTKSEMIDFLRRAAADMSRQNSISITPMLIDAAMKKSASQ
jgi:hypothetical protein